MTPEEAIRRCEWWGMTQDGSTALGSTADPEIGLYLGGDEFDYEAFSNPGKRKGWAIKIPRLLWRTDGAGKKTSAPNHLYKLIEEEIERRGE